MQFWAGVTDNNWYAFLAARGMDEVNLWRLCGTASIFEV